VKLHIGAVPTGLTRKRLRYTVTVKSNDKKNETVRLAVVATAVKVKK